jgi:transcriptional regulator with XRE-family HTH domain
LFFHTLLLFLYDFSIMKKYSSDPNSYTTTVLLSKIGQNIRDARRRRRLSTAALSSMAGIARSTLWHIETGSGSATMTAYLRVLMVMDIENTLLGIADAEADISPRIAGRKWGIVRPDEDFID